MHALLYDHDHAHAQTDSIVHALVRSNLSQALKKVISDDMKKRSSLRRDILVSNSER